MDETKERSTALQSAIRDIVSQFGKGSIMKLGERRSLATPNEAIPTGSLALDLALGGWGLPRGRVTEVFGPEASGKTSLCMTVVGNAQRMGGVAAYVDAEHAVDPAWCAKLGVRTEDLLLSQPDSGEQALEIVDRLVRSNAVDVIVVDSVAALVPKAELEGEMGDTHVGLQARLMSQALRKLTAAIARSRATAIFINQIREKIGVMFGNPETTPGGRALKFFSSVRLDVRRVTTLKDGDKPIGTRVKVTVVKNKVAPPFQKAEFEIRFDRGICREVDLFETAEAHGVLTRSGSYYEFGDKKLGPGADKAKEALQADRALAERIEAAVRKVAGVIPVSNSSTTEAEGKKRPEAGKASAAA